MLEIGPLLPRRLAALPLLLEVFLPRLPSLDGAVIDLLATLAAHCGNGFNTDFSVY
jgi:hypothetical protein